MIKDIFRPIFGFLVLQPAVLLWFYLFTDDAWKTYTEGLGWPFQVFMTIYLIPMYAFYERFFRPVPKIEMKW